MNIITAKEDEWDDIDIEIDIDDDDDLFNELLQDILENDLVDYDDEDEEAEDEDLSNNRVLH